MRIPTIRYRCPAAWEAPQVGTILMGDGPRVRRGYRILAATKGKNCMPMLGFVTWRLHVESMSATRAKEEISAGTPHWSIVWDKRSRRKPNA